MVTSRFVSFLTDIIFTFIEFLIGVRLILKLFGANPTAPFVTWIYDTSQALVGPFAGAFPAPRLSGGFVIEFSALFAMLIYAFIAYLISEFVKFIEMRVDRSQREHDSSRGKLV